ncbi:uncharacterized protein PpBr36_05650 [Pyricularia pennisetigena]|uniref:uncharacterized protein n=1 Tax=Pyricularia pennisetigena TaxID=1578925 RepID=UPI00114D71E4|nr:uncharacterized protein PpBr36_05650 [Pyricularia pennisetigena]TLS22676.1 hypothetical protein PpBr36_05650 [Pyricularia pennisetigena]
MKFFSVAITLFLAATVSAQARTGEKGNCGFPNGPTCKSTGRRNAKNAEIFTEPANSPGPNCCLLPARCGNNDVDKVCVKDTAPKRRSVRNPQVKRAEEVEEEDDQ